MSADRWLLWEVAGFRQSRSQERSQFKAWVRYRVGTRANMVRRVAKVRVG